MSKLLPVATSTGRQPSAAHVPGLLSNLANRHGCITGATSTGKTVTLQVMAEALSNIGVPVFMADVKGDLSGLAHAGAPSARMADRLAMLGVEAPAWAACPVTF